MKQRVLIVSRSSRLVEELRNLDLPECEWVQSSQLPPAGEWPEGPPTLLILDWSSLGEQARHWCRRLQEEGLQVPLLALTAPGDAERQLEAFQEGVEDCLFWPSEPERVCRRLRSLLRLGRLQQELRLQQKQFAQVQEARDDLIQNLVHDMKSPLTVMLMELGMLKRWWEKEDEERFQRSLQRLGRNCEDLVALIQNILDVGRLEAGKLQLQPRLANLGELVREVIRRLRPLVEKKDVRIDLQGENSRLLCPVDVDLMHRVLQNLLGNALKFSPSQGTIQIRLSRGEGWAEVTIQDEGPGIAPQYLPRIFEKYAQAERRALGLDVSAGIGLSFSKGVVEAHGGEIQVESSPGAGSLFRVRLPLQSQPLPEGKQS